MNRKKSFIFAALWILAISLTSITCMAQTDGNGKISREERKLTGFKAISVRNAIRLIIRQGDEQKVVAEADENILPYLKTEVVAGELRIGIKGNINHVKTMNVYVTVKQLNELDASSACKVTTDTRIEAGDMKINCTSGSAVNMELSCSNLTLRSSSGSALVLTGTAQSISAESSSGSALVTTDLKAEKAMLDASSGAALVVQVTKEVKAHASSGGQISITGNPAIRDSDSSSGGSVSFK